MKPVISKNCRIRHPEYFDIGDYSFVDDFCYFSVKVKVGQFYHIAPHCTIAGGKEMSFIAGNYGGLASGTKVYCTSDDYKNDIANVMPEGFEDIKNYTIKGDVVMDDFVTIGANTVVMPNNHIPIGTVVGSNSFVPPNFEFEPWSVYVGTKLRKVSERNKDNVLAQAKEIEKRIKDMGANT